MSSFGFSISDFFALAKLIREIVSSLRTAGGSAQRYQDLERELALLQRILTEAALITGPDELQPMITLSRPQIIPTKKSCAVQGSSHQLR
jgi:hypothetical protein